MRLRVVLAALLVACGDSSGGDPIDGGADRTTTTDGSSDAASDSPSDATATDGGAGVRYGALVQKSVHNAYERDEPLFDQLAFHRVRSVEIDLHDGKTLRPSLSFDWYVYHADAPGLNATSCDRFSDCLDEIAAFERAVPEHEVLTVLVDLKDDLAGVHDGKALDALITSRIGASLYRPSDLAAACPAATNLRGAVTGGCAWPTLDALRGRVLFVLTGGSSCNGQGKLATYAGATGLAPAAFIAPSIDDTCTFPAYAGQNDVVFYNMDLPHAAAAAAVRSAGFVGRVYKGGIGGGLDAQVDWDEAKADGAHLLATNKVNAFFDPWATTMGPKGFPFSCAGSCTLPLTERGRTLGVDVRSGDIEGSADSFTFLHDDVTAAATWEGAIAVPSSHVEEWAKACIMARVSLSPGSPYFAVCRTADVHRMRIQYRTTPGGGTTKVEMAPRPEWTDESIFFARLAVNGTSVIGSGSTDGKSWVTIGQATMPQAPTLQGAAASGHDSPSNVRLFFVELGRTEGSKKVQLTKASAKTQVCVGTCPTWTFFDGVVP